MTDEIDANKSQYSYVFSEGSTAVLNAHDFLKNKKNIETYSWKQIKTNTANILDADGITKDQFFSFNAPYINNNQINTKLYFQLTTKDKDGKTIEQPIVNVVVKRVYRAMIFQGGVALGAYEAGVFNALVEKIIEEDNNKRGVLDEKYQKRPIFDIVAGTSIGAMNGAIVINNVTRNDKRLEDKSWEEEKRWEDVESWRESARKVIQFWKDQEQHWPTIDDFFNMFPMYRHWWDLMHMTGKTAKESTHTLIDSYSKFVSTLTDSYSNLNPYFKTGYDFLMNSLLVDPKLFRDYVVNSWYIPATSESARRYYSGKQFKTLGAQNVATGLPPWLPWLFYSKFFDFSESSNRLPRADNKHIIPYSLKKTLERFVPSRIKTKEGQPRFLSVTVDVHTGDTVTFDSYDNKSKYHDNEISLQYDKGIEIDHILASGTFPNFFDYPSFMVNNSIIGSKKEEHIFWDGGFTSNTPLREVIQAHRDYWHKKRQLTTEKKDNDDDESENNVPDLEVYIADLWPSQLKEKPISFDLDFVENRKLGIIFSDKTDYDEQVANVITDYVDLVKELRNLAERKGASTNDEINYILNKHANSINTKGHTRKYKELLEGRFRLTKVVRIDHKDDGHDVGNKIFDYSYKTIENLIEIGYNDTLIQMDLQSVKEALKELLKKYDIYGRRIKLNFIESLEESFHSIQQSINNQNRYDIVVTKVDNFIKQVKNMEKLNEIKLLGKEEKILLMEAANQLIVKAKQFQETFENTTNQQNLSSSISIAN